jgi:hypothetical protein
MGVDGGMRTQGQTTSDTISILKVVILEVCRRLNRVERNSPIRPRFGVGKEEYEGEVSSSALFAGI